MSFLESVILGIVQGLTEFLPISSSGHLVLMQRVLGLGNVDVLFDIFLHLGTLGAVVVFLKKDLYNIVLNINKPFNIRTNPGSRILFLIILASIPTAFIGFFFKSYFEKIFDNIGLVACLLFVTGLLLFTSEKFASGIKYKDILGMKISDTLIIGFMQGLAIAPGISRSGATICVGIFRGIDRDLAARFSFLLSIPAILGALLLEIKDYKQMLVTVDVISLASGTVLAFVSGYFALKILFKVLKRHRLDIFAYYCWMLGLFIMGKFLIFK